MRSLLLVITTLVLVSCGSVEGSGRGTGASVSKELEDRASLYLSLSPGGWVSPEDCDSLLFSTLTAVARNGPIPDLEAAQSAPGQWFRNPSHSCYPGASASDISRDMVLGLVLYSVHFHRLDILEGLWSYGSSHYWVMGRGDDRSVLTPSSIGRLARAIAYLGGERHPQTVLGDIPSREPGYQGHLAMLGILLDGSMEGRISPLQLSALRSLVSSEGGNPLAQALLHKYTDGDQSVATQLLLQTWPSDRLPTTADWCEPWRLQRTDSDVGLEPCPATELVHTGGDFLLVAALIMGDI